MSVSRSIVRGTDGAMWFAAGNRVGRITTHGEVRAYSIALTPFQVTDLALGPDHAVWFAGFSGATGAIGRVDVHGAKLREHTSGRVWHLILGADHALWYTQDSPPAVCRLAMNGAREVRVLDAQPESLAAGAGGRVFFLEHVPEVGVAGVDYIGEMSRSGQQNLFSVDASQVEPASVAQATWVSAGPGGVWYGSGSLLARLSAAGESTFFSPKSPNSKPSPFVVGADGDLWFTEYNISAIGRLGLLAQSRR